MDFFMLCCRKRTEYFGSIQGRVRAHLSMLWPLLLALSFGMFVSPLRAAEIEPQRANLALSDDVYLLSADFNVELSARLEDIVNHGVPLYFVLEFELTRPRWYWFNEAGVEKNRIYRLTYHALTRQYRLYSGALYQAFPTLAEALAILSRVRSWSVAEKAQLKPGETYQAAVRLRLDWAQLPKPLQITAMASREWNLGVEWLRWPLAVPPAAASVAPVAPAAEAK